MRRIGRKHGKNGITEVRVYAPDEIPKELKSLFNGIFGVEGEDGSPVEDEQHHINHKCDGCSALSSLARFSTEFIYSLDDAFDPNGDCNNMKLEDYTPEYLLGSFRQAIGSIQFAKRSIEAAIGECNTEHDIMNALIGIERAFMATCNILISMDKGKKNK